MHWTGGEKKMTLQERKKLFASGSYAFVWYRSQRSNRL